MSDNISANTHKRFLLGQAAEPSGLFPSGRRAIPSFRVLCVFHNEKKQRRGVSSVALSFLWFLHHDIPCRASQQEGDDVTNHLKNHFPCLVHNAVCF